VAERRDAEKGTTTYEAVLPATAGPFRLTIVGGNRETLHFSGRLVFTWRPDPLAPEAVYPAETALRHVRRILTSFAPGAAYLYEIWASDKPNPREALDSGDWSLLVPAKVGQGRVTDLVDTRATHLRTRFRNLLTNSGFEQPITPKPEQPRLPFDLWWPDRPYCTIDTSVAHTGARSAKIAATGRTPADPWSNWGQILRVKPETTYTVSAYVKVGDLAPDATVSLNIHGYPANTEEQLNNQGVPARRDLSGWQRLALTVKTAPGVVRLAVWCDVRGNGVAWWDDAQVIQGDTPTDIPEVLEQRFGE
jgi:Carbohydrate binding domain